MDVIEHLNTSSGGVIKCVDMHTSGEPTRIVVSGYPELTGTLLEQRTQARIRCDNIRKTLMLEPRGHFDMYGAVLRPDTELTRTGIADIGVLFLTNDGYSTMCGHATIALGRFLVDTQDTTVFPNRRFLKINAEASTVLIRLHAPCGLVEVTVPVSADGLKSNPDLPVSFHSVPSFATGLRTTINIPPEFRWPSLTNRTSIVADFAYGGAFYCLVRAKELGFENGLKDIDLAALNRATKSLKSVIKQNAKLHYLFQHPTDPDLSFLYSVIVSDETWESDSEIGVCYFSDQQLDRSPTGSGVSARLAVSYASGDLGLGQSRIYHSLVSKQYDRMAFTGTLVEESTQPKSKFPSVITEIAGFAYYTGTHSFFVEDGDGLGRTGFILV